MAAASSHTHKYSNVSSTPGSEPTSEPIYQNQVYFLFIFVKLTLFVYFLPHQIEFCVHNIFFQAELRKQLQLLDKREPIYQNLPAHEKMLLKEHQQLLLVRNML